MYKIGKTKYVRTPKRIIPIITICLCAVLLFIIFLTNSFLIHTNSSIQKSTAELSRFYLKELAERRAETIANIIEIRKKFLLGAADYLRNEKITNQNELRQSIKKIKNSSDMNIFFLIDEDGMIYTDESTFSGISRLGFIQTDLSKTSINVTKSFGQNHMIMISIPVQGIYFNNKKIVSCVGGSNANKFLTDIFDKNTTYETTTSIFDTEGNNIAVNETSPAWGKNILHYTESTEVVFDKEFIAENLIESWKNGKEVFGSFMINNTHWSIYSKPIQDTNWILTIRISDTIINNQLLKIQHNITKASLRQELYISIAVLILCLIYIKVILIFRYLYRHDQLTGLFNRYGFNELVDKKIEKYSSSKASCIMIDIDNFKHVNDTFGHAAGDEVLKLVANTLFETLENKTPYCRWGGEEFNIFVLDKLNAYEVAEKIRTKIEAAKILYENKTIQITISLGICSSNLFNKDLISSLILNADKALYSSKNSGKNKITVVDL